MRKTPWLLATALMIAGCSSAPTPPATQQLQDGPVTKGPAAGGGGTDDVTVSFKTQVVPILKDHCAKCHVAGNPNVPFTMFDADGNPQQATVAFRITDMIAAVRAKKMPKDKPGSVSEQELGILEAWNAQGAPDN